MTKNIKIYWEQCTYLLDFLCLSLPNFTICSGKFLWKKRGGDWEIESDLTSNITNVHLQQQLISSYNISFRVTTSNENINTKMGVKKKNQIEIALHSNGCGFIKSKDTRKLFAFQQFQTSTTTSWNVAHHRSNSYFLYCSNRISTSNDCCHSLPTKFC